MRTIDYSVYLVTDAANRYGPPGLLANVEQAVAGGVSVVQYRPTGESRALQYEVARSLRAWLSVREIPLVVNDFADLALAVDADGVHVGQSDLPIAVVRRLIGPDKVIGLSITRREQLDNTADADYLGVGPVYPTPTKTDAAPALGLEELTAIARQSALPVVAIGGITLANAAAVYAAGADGVAVVSAFSQAADPADVARRFRAAKAQRRTPR